MEKLASVLAEYMYRYNENPKFSYDVYRYCFLLFMEMATGSVTGLLIAIYMSVQMEAVVFLVVFFLLRSYAGGFHCQTFLKCYLASTGILAGVFLLVKHWKAAPFISFILILIFGGILAVLDGCESKNRPVDSEEAISFKKKLIRILAVTIILFMVFIVLGYERCALSVSLAVTVSGLLMVIGKRKTNEKI